MAANPLDSEDLLPVIGVGPVFPGQEVMIVSEKGENLGERMQGEIWLRGDSLADGYFEDPEATGEAFVDGWLHTGDLGYLVGEELFICGRQKDLIIRSGENVHPYVLELAACKVAGVRPSCAAAVSLPNPRTGTEDVIVVFETKEMDEEKIRAIRRQVNDRVFFDTGIRPDFTLPVKPKTIPKTSSGKICRKIVRDDIVPKLLEEMAEKGRYDSTLSFYMTGLEQSSHPAPEIPAPV